MDNLLKLVSDVAVLQRAWERDPFVSTGLADFRDVFSVERAESLLSSGLPLGSIRMFQQGELLAPDAFARQRERGAADREPLVDAVKVTQRLAGGATLVLEELQTFSREVAQFAANIAQETGYSTYCAAFLTTGGSRGVGPHYDTASVFIRQVMGAKRWRVSAPVQRWPAHASPVEPPAAEPILDVVLKENDCLYIPRGFVHVGDATDSASAHLSIAVAQLTWGTVLRRLLTTASATVEPLREALPPRFAQIDRDALFRDRLAVLAQCLDAIDPADTALSAFDAVAGRSPTPQPGSLIRALNRRGEPSYGDG